MSSHAYTAGLLDAAGHIFERRGGGLAIRIVVPMAEIAHELRNTYGGSVTDGKPPRWNLNHKENLDKFIADISPFTRGQKVPLEILYGWLTNQLDLEKASATLESFYELYMVSRIFTWAERQNKESP